MNIQQLEYLIAVDKYKHFGKAAQACFITQPTLSAMIQKFEDENCFMVLQVHDEITFCIRRDMISHYEPMIVQAMINFPIFEVTLAVEGKEWK